MRYCGVSDDKMCVKYKCSLIIKGLMNKIYISHTLLIQYHYIWLSVNQDVYIFHFFTVVILFSFKGWKGQNRAWQTVYLNSGHPN